jgi:hypothetical protein
LVIRKEPVEELAKYIELAKVLVKYKAMHKELVDHKQVIDRNLAAIDTMVFTHKD